jgi:hypothetical protein
MRKRARIIALSVALLATLPSSSASHESSESERRALFLANLLKHITWPQEAFQDQSEPLRLHVVGRDPFDGALDRLFAETTINDRRVAVTHLAAPMTTPLPHVAFVAADEEPRIAEILPAYCRMPVLTVSDIEQFANRGGVIGLVGGGIWELIEDDHALHFSINRTAVYEAHLQIDPALLHLAYPLFSAVSPCRTARSN